MDAKAELEEAIRQLNEDEVLDVLSYIQTLREPRTHTGEDLAETLAEEKLAFKETEEQRLAERSGP